MKKVCIILLSICLLSACNSGVLSKNEEKKEKRDKEKSDNDEDEKTDADDEENGNADDTKSKWTAKMRKKWLDQCIEASGNAPRAKTVCSCVLEKLEKKYPDPEDAQNAGEAEGERLAKACMGSAGDLAGDGEGYDDGNFTRNEEGDDEEDNGNGNSWTNLQRRQFIQGCASTAQQAQGLTAQQANQYCDCMTRKVEKKYSFREASRLTAAEFQTQEWTDAALDCRSRLDY